MKTQKIKAIAETLANSSDRNVSLGADLAMCDVEEGEILQQNRTHEEIAAAIYAFVDAASMVA